MKKNYVHFVALFVILLVFNNLMAQEKTKKPLLFSAGAGAIVNGDFGYTIFNSLQMPVFKSIAFEPSLNYGSSALYNFGEIEYDAYNGGMVTRILTASNNTYATVNGDFFFALDFNLVFKPLELFKDERLKKHEIGIGAGGGFRHYSISYIYFQLITVGVYEPYYFYQYNGGNFDYSLKAKYMYHFSDKWSLGADFSMIYFGIENANSVRFSVARNLR